MSRFFSNGTSYDLWAELWCWRCANDHPSHEERYEDGCHLIGRSLVEDYNDPDPVLTELWPQHRLDDGYTEPQCLMFTECRACPNDGRDEAAAELRQRVGPQKVGQPGGTGSR